MKKILLIEDDRKIAAALAVRLEAAGYEVQTAHDGFRGLKLALDDRPDLLLMDIWMPVGTGFSVAQRLQSLGLRGIPIVFITASRLQGLREAAETLGAAGFFEKPYDSEQLLEAIARALEQSTFLPTSLLPICSVRKQPPQHEEGPPRGKWVCGLMDICVAK